MAVKIMRRRMMPKYKVMFTYEEEIEASDFDDAIIQVGMNSRILEHLGSDAVVEEIKDEEKEDK